MKNFEILEHTADLKIKVLGCDLPELFKNTAIGMFSAAIGREIKNQKSKTKNRKLEISGNNREELLINFLNELIFLADVFKEIYLDFDFQEFSDKKIIGIASGSPIPSQGFKVEIKAATLHDLKIKKTKKGFQAVILFDI